MASLCQFLAALLVLTATWAPSAAQPMNVFEYRNVGGPGSYGSVTSMPCGSCMKEEKRAGGALAPFNEEVTLVLRGPLRLYNLAVYQPATRGSWRRVSYYTPTRRAASNLVFLNNAGTFTCNGGQQGYATPDGKKAQRSPAKFGGWLETGVSVNVMTGTKCAGASCGFARGMAHKGWSGPSKLFVFRVSMPDDFRAQPWPFDYNKNMPAAWLLHAQVVRTGQYGCNCRGMGGDGGCGEIDLLEVIAESQDKLISQLYSYRGSSGTGSARWFERPRGAPATFFALLDGATNKVKIVRAADQSFRFPGRLSGKTIRNLRNMRADLTTSL